MTIGEFLAAKRDGREHSAADLEWFAAEIRSDRVSRVQVAGWLMAAYLNGLTHAETAALTQAMAGSGERLDLSRLRHPVVDKHSTGGVGDAVTPILLPIVAACGVTMVKLSGGGLGFTGGTVDKLAAIPGMRTALSMDEIIATANRVGCAWSGQTSDLAPLDKVFYSIRSETETVSSVPLIASSIMSKKLAANSDAIVLDVKVGSGALMKRLEDARALAETMIQIGNSAGKKTIAVLTDMNQPLASCVGNAVEVRAAIEELKSGCKGRLGSATVAIAKQCAAAAGIDPSTVQQVIEDGKALQKMSEWIAAQGGDADVVNNPEGVLPKAKNTKTVSANQSGWIRGMDCEAIGRASRHLGAGIEIEGQAIDFGAGIEMRCEIGDRIEEGQTVFVLHASDESRFEDAERMLSAALQVGEKAVPAPAVYEVIGSR